MPARSPSPLMVVLACVAPVSSSTDTTSPSSRPLPRNTEVSITRADPATGLEGIQHAEGVGIAHPGRATALRHLGRTQQQARVGARGVFEDHAGRHCCNLRATRLAAIAEPGSFQLLLCRSKLSGLGKSYIRHKIA